MTVYKVRGVVVKREAYEQQRHVDGSIFGKFFERVDDESRDLLDPFDFMRRCVFCGRYTQDMRPRIILNPRYACAICRSRGVEGLRADPRSE